ncbi:MAG: hypothetical protein V3W28_06670 [Thermoplasmata archaeon]
MGQGGGGDIYDAFGRWDNVTIPAGATIDVAYVTVEEKTDTGDGGQKVEIAFNLAGDAVAPTDRAEYAALVQTVARVAWDDIDFTADTPTNTPSLATIVQEVLDGGGWNSGQAMMVLFNDDGSAANNFIGSWSYDGDSSRAYKLHVEYST